MSSSYKEDSRRSACKRGKLGEHSLKEYRQGLSIDLKYREDLWVFRGSSDLYRRATLCKGFELRKAKNWVQKEMWQFSWEGMKAFYQNDGSQKSRKYWSR